ncbi:hypothetical protein OC844_002945 [Tilletia horrida]|nr:hypothetical protein OC844_002945 [Tilletia horrida]
MPSQTSTADIYVACLYSQGDGLPLWNPSPIRTGAIGYVRDGSFFTLFNIEDGPPTEVHPAADPTLVGRRRSTPASHQQQQLVHQLPPPHLPHASLASTLHLPAAGTDTHARSDSVGSGTGAVTAGTATPLGAGSGLPTAHRASDPVLPGAGAIGADSASSNPPRSVSVSARGGLPGSSGAYGLGSGGSGGALGSSTFAGARRSSAMGISLMGGAASTLRSPPLPPASSLSDPIGSPTGGDGTRSPVSGTGARSAGSMTPPYVGGGGGGGAAAAAGSSSDARWNSPRGDETRSPRLRERDLPPEPPMPLQTEYEDLRRFDAGPRSSSTYTCLGFSAGAQVPGAPAGGMWSFKSSGGDGALLIPRDPTEREQLRHVGNLKIYVKTHLRWIAYRYGISEDIEPDDIVLVFSQDRTSDWACAVSRNTSKGAQVEFEVFSVGKASVWGEWRTAMTASQRGPHRGGPPVFNPNFAMGTVAGAPSPGAGNGGHDNKKPGSSSAAATAAAAAAGAGIGFSLGGVTASFSPTLDAQVRMDTSEDSAAGGGSGNGNELGFGVDLRFGTGGGGGGGGPERGNGGARPGTLSGDASPYSNSGAAASSSLMHQQQQQQRQGNWPHANPHPADQAIIIKRITMKHRLPFLPASIRASAEPKPDGPREGEEDEDARRVMAAGATEGSGGELERGEQGGRAAPTRTGRAGASPVIPSRSSSLATRSANAYTRKSAAAQAQTKTNAKKKEKSFDPLNLLHEYILTRAPLARASIASDAECAYLLRAALHNGFGGASGGRARQHETSTGVLEEEEEEEEGVEGQGESLLSPRWMGQIRRALFRAADACARVDVDPSDGVATLLLDVLNDDFDGRAEVATAPTSARAREVVEGARRPEARSEAEAARKKVVGRMSTGGGRARDWAPHQLRTGGLEPATTSVSS